MCTWGCHVVCNVLVLFSFGPGFLLVFGWLFCVSFWFSWENSFNKRANLLQYLKSTNHHCLVISRLDRKMKTQRLLELDLTPLHYFLSFPLPLFPSRTTDASLIGKMQSVQVVLALWLNILSCCTIMLTLLHRESAWKNPRSTVLVQATTIPFLVGSGKRDSTQTDISELISWFDLKRAVWRKASGILQI